MVQVRHHLQLGRSAQVCGYASALPMLYSPVINNVQVTKTLVDGGAGLNVLSVKTFDSLQVPYDQL